MPLSAGTRLGPYEILAPLGAGGMGEVYRARDTRLGREVAVKVLPAALAQDAQALRRLEQEARAVAALNHPNLLSIHDVGTTPEGSLYMVAELLEGESVRQKLAAGPLPQRRAVEYAIQIARGLAAAHDKGIIHRDLKPDNIFCTRDGRVKILDFGLAKLTEASVAEEKTMATNPATSPGMTLGTMGYMSPEQVRGQPVDARSDLFSFGAVLYEMLAGERAFRGESAADIMSAILREEPPELAAAAHPVGPALDRIVRHCLEKEPQQRFQSAGDLAFHLEQLSQASSGSAPAVAAGGSAGRSRSRRRAVFASAGTAGLVAAAALAWWAGRATLSRDPPHWQAVTFQQGTAASAHFLPDGQSFVTAAAWGTDAGNSLYTGRLDNPGLQSLNTAADAVLAVSRAGEAVILQDDPGFRSGLAGTLARMPISGGGPRAVMQGVVAADWTPDGSGLAVVRKALFETLEYPAGHVLYKTAGWIGDVRFSRDGKRIAFLDHPIGGDDRGRAAAVDLEGRETDVSPVYSTANGLAWSPGGDEIWFTAGNNSVRALYAASLNGKVRLLLQAPGTLTLDDILPDGRVLLGFDSMRAILMVVTPEHPRGLDLSIMRASYQAQISNDGKEILIGEQSAGPSYATYLRSTGGSPPVKLGDGNAVALSPDGQWAVSALPTSPLQLMLLPTGAGQPHQLTHEALSYLGGNWYPDSHALIAIGDTPGHTPRSYRIGLDGNVTPLTPEGWTGTVITPDGKDVLVRHLGRYYFFPTAGGTPFPLPATAGLQNSDQLLRFGATRDELYVANYSPNGPPVHIWRVNLKSGQRMPAFDIAPPDLTGVTGIGSITLSTDGKAYAYSYTRDLSTLYVITGLGK